MIRQILAACIFATILTATTTAHAAPTTFNLAGTINSANYTFVNPFYGVPLLTTQQEAYLAAFNPPPFSFNLSFDHQLGSPQATFVPVTINTASVGGYSAFDQNSSPASFTLSQEAQVSEIQNDGTILELLFEFTVTERLSSSKQYNREFQLRFTADPVPADGIASNPSLISGYARVYSSSNGITIRERAFSGSGVSNFAITTGNTPVPEPASLSLLVTGLVALTRRRPR